MNYRYFKKSTLLLLIISVLTCSCKSGPFSVFKSSSPHELYKKGLISSGLNRTAMGKTWIKLSDQILQTPVTVKIPYLEKGYFPSEEVRAASFSFKMQRGQKLNVKLTRKPLDGFEIYTDIWEKDENGTLRILGSIDTLGRTFQLEIDQTSNYIVRLQPELLAGGEYTLEITSGPSLDYPLGTFRNNQIRSFWGDNRDAGSRKHEGVDIFSPFRTPVLASAPGSIRVNENELGGKVVWLRPEGKNYTLYYAHLDEQTVSNGEYVQKGDTVGLMGNTGNARSTPPHLHFGIYARGGAVDPLPFIDPRVQVAQQLPNSAPLLNSLSRTTQGVILTGAKNANLQNGTIVKVVAAAGSTYRVELPDGTQGYIPSKQLASTASRIKTLKLSGMSIPVFDKPDSSAAVKVTLQSGETVNLIGRFGVYDMISTTKNKGWILSR